MRRRVGRYLLMYAVIALLSVALGHAVARPGAPASASASGTTSVGLMVPAADSKPVDTHAFTMSGAVVGLSPGRTATLPVLVTNPNSQSIKVLTIGVTAGNASSACPAQGNLSVTGYDSSVPGASVYIVPSRGSLTVPLPAKLLDDPKRNQNACKGAVFPLSYVGTAMQWGT